MSLNIDLDLRPVGADKYSRRQASLREHYCLDTPLKIKQKLLYPTWGKAKKEEGTSFTFEWLFSSHGIPNNPSQHALGHELMLQECTQAQQWEKPQSRNRVKKAGMPCAWSKTTSSDPWYNTDQDLRENRSILLPSRALFCSSSSKNRQNSADKEKLQASGHSGVSSLSSCSPQGLIPLPEYCTSGILCLQNASSGVLFDPKQQMVYCLCSRQGHSGVLSGPRLGCTVSSCIHFGNVSWFA